PGAGVEGGGGDLVGGQQLHDRDDALAGLGADADEVAELTPAVMPPAHGDPVGLQGATVQLAERELGDLFKAPSDGGGAVGVVDPARRDLALGAATPADDLTGAAGGAGVILTGAELDGVAEPSDGD